MTRLILIRHGQSLANVQLRFAGHSDFDLSDIGKQQAELAAEYLYRHEHIDAVHTSDLSRAAHTAQPIAERFGLPLIRERGLREIYAGEWESMTFEEIRQNYAEIFHTWKTDCGHLALPGGESMKEVYARAAETARRLATQNEGKTIVLATHAMFLRSFICYAAGKDFTRICDYPSPPNASLNIYRYENGGFIPEALNIVSHLGDLVTSFKRE